MSLKLMRPVRGSFRNVCASPIISENRGIVAARSSSATVPTKSTNSSMDFDSLQRAGPSAAASMLESQAAKQLPVF